MDDQGLHNKYYVERTDGQSDVGKRHDGCDYFVLDLTHDPYAMEALSAYVDVCERTRPELARDLRARYPLGR